MDVQFVCLWCGAQLKARSADAGTKYRCPKCSSLIAVPRESDVIDTRPAREGYAVREEPARAEDEGGEKGVGRAVEERPQVGEPGAARPKAGVRAALPPSERPQLPRWPMFSGTVTFLFCRSSLLCWLGLSVATLLVLAVIKLAIALGNLPSTSNIAGPAMIMSAMAAACSALFLLVWLVTTSICMLTVLQETAAGNDQVMDWPGLNFIDWVADALYVINSVTVCVPVGLLIAWGFDGTGIDGGSAVAASIYLLFPLVLLSMLEAQSRATPVTTAVLWTLVRAVRTWLLFYLETALLAIGTLGLIAGMEALWGLPAIVPATILVIGALLLYFRLLGRLAWCCAEATRP